MRHPAGGAGTLVGDGKPLDSGTACLITNNITHLRNESLRPLFSDVGPGELGVVNSGGWLTLNEAEEIPASATRTGTVG